MVWHGEATNGDAFFDQPNPIGARCRRGPAVICDHSADNNSPMGIHPLEYCILDWTTGIFKVNINALGRQFGKFCDDVIGFIINRGVKA